MSPLDLEQRAAHLANVRILALSGLADSMRKLGCCLRDAGALCLAHDVGYEAARDTYWKGRFWRPGCGKPAPGVTP